jgi:hypothetical protein
MSDSFGLQRFVNAQAAKTDTLNVVHFAADRRSRLQRNGSTLRSARAPRRSLTWSMAWSGLAWSNAHTSSWLQAKRP